MRLSTPCVRKLRGKGTRHHGRLLRRNLLRARRPESQHVRCDAFSGKNTGFLGYVQNANIHFYNSSDRVHSTAAEFDVSGIEKLPKVGVLYSTVGTDAELIDAMLGLGVKGNVLCSGGAGGTSQAIADKLGEASGASVPVISCSRIAGGLIDVYNARDAIQLSSHAEAGRPPLRTLYDLVKINRKSGIDSHRDGFLERIHHRRRVLGESGDHRPAHRGVDDPVLPHTGLAIEVLLGANTPRPSFHAKDVRFYPLKIVYDRVFYNNRLPH